MFKHTLNRRVPSWHFRRPRPAQLIRQSRLLAPYRAGQAFARSSSLAFSTFSLVRISVIRRLKIIGSHRYMIWSILIQEADCSGAPPTYPLYAKSHPATAVPMPPPSFVPREVQEYIVPSTRLPVFKKVYSEQVAMRAFISP